MFTWPPPDARQVRPILSAKVHDVKTTIPIFSLLEHEILNWAICPGYDHKTESRAPSGWSSWDRTGVLNSRQLVLDSRTPHISGYAEFILLRLRGLSEGVEDAYSQAAQNLYKRISHIAKSKLTSHGQTPRNSPKKKKLACRGDSRSSA